MKNMTQIYHCDGLRPIRETSVQEGDHPSTIFARRLARRAFGRKGIVRTLVEDSWDENRDLIEYAAFIGYRSGPGETTGHNVRFTVRIERRAA